MGKLSRTNMHDAGDGGLALLGERRALGRSLALLLDVPRPSRRAFLKSAAALTPVVVATACDPLPPSGFSSEFYPSDEPRLYTSDDGSLLTIAFIGYRSEISARWFGDARASARETYRSKEGRIDGGLLPGLGLEGGIRLSVYSRLGRWFISLTIAGLAFGDDHDLLEWLRGDGAISTSLPLYERVRLNKALRGFGLSIPLRDRVSLSVHANWRLQLAAGSAAQTALIIESYGQSLQASTVDMSFALREAFEEAECAVDKETGRPATIDRFGLRIQGLARSGSDPILSLPLARADERVELRAPRDVKLDAFLETEETDVRRATVLVEGTGSVDFAVRPDAPWLRDLPAAGWCWAVERWVAPDATVATQGTFLADLAKTAAPARLGTAALHVLRASESPAKSFFAAYGADQTVASDHHFEIVLDAVDLPMEGATEARLHFRPPSLDVAGLEPGDTPPRLLQIAPARNAGAPRNSLYPGADLHGGARVDGEGTALVLKRAEDMLDLAVSFQAADIVLDGEGAQALAQGDEAAMALHLPPQHVAERAFFYQSAPDGGEPPTLNVDIDANRYASEDDRRTARESLDLDYKRNRSNPDYSEFGDLRDALHQKGAVASRAAAPTRIVFDLPGSTTQPLRLDAASLTKWDMWSLRVADRAKAEWRDFDKALEGMRITSAMSRADVIDRVRNSVRRPDRFETALGLHYRLDFSPTEKARWRTREGMVARPRDDGTGVAMRSIWDAQLDESGDIGMRAIWSPDFDPDAFSGNGKHPDHSFKAPWDADTAFRTSLDGRDRHELVSLTALYGLPTLAAVSRSAAQATLETGRSLVARPARDFSSLRQKEGFYQAKPMRRADVRVSGLGAYVRMEGNWQPPAPQTGTGRDWPALTVERLSLETALRRDRRVEIVYKGFLFPLGVRASLVKITERAFLKVGHVTKRPIAPLVQRMFIVVGSPEKSFAALGQPYAGRDWPVGRLVIETATTPDIVDPFNGSNGGQVLTNDLTGAAFWPRVAPRAGAEVVFEYKLDGDALPVRSKLLFVDNTAAHWPSDIKRLQEYYNEAQFEDGLSDLNRVDMRGQRRRYAESLSPGDTEFETHSWVLGAHERGDVTGNRDPLAAYRMDAAMEGEDQPPFYPFVHRALVNVQSVRALSGGGGRVTVGYAGIYREQGFDGRATGRAASSKANPAEIYLEVKRRPPAMDFSGDGTNSGGLAKPNISVVAFSRTNGAVGGRRRPPVPTQAKPLAPYRVETESEIEIDVDQALDGVFDAAQFFGGAFADAKLLGLLKLSDIVKLTAFAAGAPKMVEEFLYQLPGDADFLDGAVRLIGKLSGGVNDLLKDPEAAWCDLYPRLTERLLALQAVLNKASDAAEELEEAVEKSPKRSLSACLAAPRGTRDPGCEPVLRKYRALLGATPALVAEARALSDEIERLRSNPMPMVLSDTFEKVRATVHAFRSVAENLEAAVMNGIREALDQAFDDQIKAMEKQICARPLRGTANATELSREEGAVNYAATYLYGKPIWFTVEDANGRKQPVRCEAPPFDRHGSPSFDALRDALLYDFVTGPVMKAAVELETVFAAERNRLKSYAPAVRQLAHAAAAIENLDLPAMLRSKIREELRARCSETLERLIVELAPIDANLKASFAQTRRALDIVTGLDPQQVYDALKRGDETAARRARRALRDLQGETRTLSDRLARAERDMIEDLQRLGDGTLCDRLFGPPQADLAALEVDPNFLEQRAKIAATITRLQNLRRDAIADLETLNTALSDAAVFIDGLDPAECIATFDLHNPIEGDTHRVTIDCGDLVRTLKALRKDAPAQAARLSSAMRLDELRTVTTEIEAFVDRLGASVHPMLATLKETAAAAAVAAEDVRTKVAAAQSQLEAAARAKAMEAVRLYEAEVDRQLTALLLYAEAAEEKLVAEARVRLAAILKPVLSFGVAVHEQAEAGHELLMDAMRPISSPELKRFLALLLSQEAEALLDNLVSAQIGQNLKRDRELFEKALRECQGGNGTAPRFTTLRDSFAGEDLFLLSVVEDLASISQPFGEPSFDELLELIGADAALEALEDALKEAVAAFVPTAVNLSYNWQTALRPFPAGNPIFEMDSRRSGTGAPDEDPDKDLVIDAKGGVDVLTGSKSFAVVSMLKPFRINLFPGFDLATIRFKGARFTADQNGPDFTTKIKKVELGSNLEYIARLAQLLAPNNGPYVQLIFDPFGIEAGYRLDVGSFNLGALAFSNIALEVGCELPLDNREATFRFGLSSRARPFLISSPPYGGGGSASIRTRASTIISLSTSFEFGAVTDLSFGPLKALGRVTTGIYVNKSSSRSATVTGFFIAMGEGSIAFFHVCVCFSVSLTMAGSSMVGRARYSFSFKAGFLRYRYGVGVSYQLSGGNGSQAALTSLQADSTGDTATIATEVPSEEIAWADYHALFA